VIDFEKVGEMIGFGQRDLKDDGKRDVDSGIRSGLDWQYPDWKDPQGTYMVPNSFPNKHNLVDKGARAEEDVYNLLQQLGTQNSEPMFVVHSFDFSEHIPGKEIQRKRSWVMGECDFVIIHRKHGPVFIQVKATESGNKQTRKEAQEQLRKDKLALENFFEKLVKKKISTKKAKEIFKNVPAFVAMPNCQRGDESVCVHENVLYQEDCSSLQAFAKWWNEKISSAEHPDVDQKLYEYLVMRFVGMSYLSPSVGPCVDHTEKVLLFKTREQMEILAGCFPPELWIRGPAGSGKTYLLMEKASALACDVLRQRADKKILIVCFNTVLCKALEKRLNNLVAEEICEESVADPSSVFHFTTFTKLVMDVASLPCCPATNDEKERAVNEALQCVQQSGSTFRGCYDHIFVDEGQDFYGNNWPELLKKMHKSSVDTDEHAEFKDVKLIIAGLEDLQLTNGSFWVMYDINQYLYFSEERCTSHLSQHKGSAVLSKVFRNTESVFKQSKKYYKSLDPRDHPISLGHREVGLPIIWDNSLVSRSGEEMKGVQSICYWLKVLNNQEVQRKDICILVETQNKQSELAFELDSLKTPIQTGDDLVEGKKNLVILESVRRFKGLESKVVILYNPPFQDDSSSHTKELLYTAVSRSSCLLIVISTKEGCEALKSGEGVTMQSKTTRRQTKRPWQTSTVLESEQKLQIQAYEYGPFVENDYNNVEGEIIPEARLSSDEIKMYQHQDQLSRKRAKSNNPRAMEVDGSNLFEPGDPYITDLVRNGVFGLLSDTAEKNLKHVPSNSELDPGTLKTTKVVASMEYEIYCKRRSDCHPRNYTNDLRRLKKEINSFNDQETYHEAVIRAVRSARIYSCKKVEQDVHSYKV